MGFVLSKRFSETVLLSSRRRWSINDHDGRSVRCRGQHRPAPAERLPLTFVRVTHRTANPTRLDSPHRRPRRPNTRATGNRRSYPMARNVYLGEKWVESPCNSASRVSRLTRQNAVRQSVARLAEAWESSNVAAVRASKRQTLEDCEDWRLKRERKRERKKERRKEASELLSPSPSVGCISSFARRSFAQFSLCLCVLVCVCVCVCVCVSLCGSSSGTPSIPFHSIRLDSTRLGWKQERRGSTQLSTRQPSRPTTDAALLRNGPGPRHGRTEQNNRRPTDRPTDVGKVRRRTRPKPALARKQREREREREREIDSARQLSLFRPTANRGAVGRWRNARLRKILEAKSLAWIQLCRGSCLERTQKPRLAAAQQHSLSVPPQQLLKSRVSEWER